MNSVIYQMAMVNFPTRIPECDSHSPAVLHLFVSSDTSICSTVVFPPFENSDHVVVSFSIDFLSNSKRYAPFHCMAYDCSYADWDSLHDHLRDVLWEDLLLLVNFVSSFRMDLIYISFVNVWSSLTHVHGFQLLVLLP